MGFGGTGTFTHFSMSLVEEMSVEAYRSGSFDSRTEVSHAKGAISSK